MNNYLLWTLYICAVLIEAAIDLSKFVLVHSIVCTILLKDAIQSIDWAAINQQRNRIGSYFVYA